MYTFNPPPHTLPIRLHPIARWHLHATHNCAFALPYEVLVYLFSFCLFKGLRALHAAGLTHRNLHPRNVHLDAKGRAVLTGYQVLANPRAPGDPYSWGRADCGGTLVLAPEVDAGHPVSAAADVWALGVCLLAWATGDADGGGPAASAKERSLEELLRAVPRRFGAQVRSALRMCLQHHPAKRATAADLWKVLSTSSRK